MKQLSLFCAFGLVLSFLNGCANLGYYLRAGAGQNELQERARPIPEVLADPSTPDWLRTRLGAVEQIRDFAARELLLPDGGNYRDYADLGRPYAVWNVVAAPEFSTKPTEWCFPVAGCVSYRGYFSREEALGLADELRSAGYDVHAEGVPAYSTLGWFQDPVLNTFIRYSDRELAGLLFHELAHRLLYVKNDSTFNESFATAVELEGLRRWLSATGKAAEAVEADKAEARARGFRSFIATWKQRLDEIYGGPAGADEKRRRKQRAFEELREAYAGLRASWGGYPGYDGWFSRELNNARLAAISTYTELVPAFRALLDSVSTDLPHFYEACRALASLSKDERHRRLRELTHHSADSVGALQGPQPGRPL